MKTEVNILVAFILNISFAIFEFFGGLFTNSVAIISDAVHDMGDALSIGLSYFLEKKSKKEPDDKYTYGYVRYSIMGATITTIILLVGSLLVIGGAIKRIINPVEINYDGMIIFAILGVIVNFLAAYFTRKGDSINQRSVNLHMLEDVLGWAVVLVGAIVMKFTSISIIDPIMSILVAIFILVNSWSNFKIILNLFLEKIPDGISVTDVKAHLLEIKGIKDIHHIHIWSMDGVNNYATMHVVVDRNNKQIKDKAKALLKELGISHVTMEVEASDEVCDDLKCHVDKVESGHHHHHHH